MAIRGTGALMLSAVSFCACSASNAPPPVGNSDAALADTLNIPKVRPPIQAELPQKLLAGGTMFSSASFGVGSLTEALGGGGDGGSDNSGGTDGGIDYTTTCTNGAMEPCGSYSWETQRSQRILCIIKQRLFCAGPTELLSLINDVDGLTQMIAMRAGGASAPCLSETAVDHTSDLMFAGGKTFTHYLQCKDSEELLGFGKKDNTWYTREASAVGIGGNIFSIDADSNVSGYIWLGDPMLQGSTVLLEIKTNKANGTVEFTGGGIAVGFCSMRFRSNASNIWILINADGADGSCDSDGSNTTDSNDFINVCLDATTLTPSADDTACDGLKSGKELDLIGRAELTPPGGLIAHYAAAAPPPAGETLDSIDLSTLQTLSMETATFTGVTEFTVAAGDGGMMMMMPGPGIDGGMH